jgi:uncharacterized protein (TIGR03084 family)
MNDTTDVTTALTAECDDLDQLLSTLSPDQWALATPAPDWTVAHQVGHLAATFHLAGLAASDPPGFIALMASLGEDFNRNVNNVLASYLSDSPEVLFSRWQAERHFAVKALEEAPPQDRLPWLVNPIPPSILAAAGMAEAFAHGQDIADTVGATRVRTDRLQAVVAFGVRTWDFGYLARKQEVPAQEFHFTLTAPSGAVWEFGPDDASDTISGPAVDFCLLVSRRRHRDDLALTAVGAAADGWLDIAQAYRGPSGAGRSAGQFAR